MPTFFEYALRTTWILVLLYWLLAAPYSKNTKRQEPLLTRLLAYWLPLLIAALLLGPGSWFGRSLLREQFVPHTTLVYSLGLITVLLGAILAVYARAILGHNWSATVQLKEQHQLITHGPYRWIRHPIYSGFLLLVFGNAIMIGDWRGLLAVLIVFVSFWRKLRLEENWLAEHFGASYQDYRSRTKALVPALF